MPKPSSRLLSCPTKRKWRRNKGFRRIGRYQCSPIDPFPPTRGAHQRPNEKKNRGKHKWTIYNPMIKKPTSDC